ncbi:hypothetical protein KSD_61960 [Ktedonobacter sp. SOSP1-85]|nr:hypothetical protein KSD_61960 [Ktedonobacter sp. SOSP1-85]
MFLQRFEKAETVAASNEEHAGRLYDLTRVDRRVYSFDSDAEWGQHVLHPHGVAIVIGKGIGDKEKIAFAIQKFFHHIQRVFQRFHAKNG